MHNRFAMLALVGAASLAACGGGTVSKFMPVAHSTPAPTNAPSSTPQGKSNVPLQETVAGAPAFVNPLDHHTLYFVDGDTPPGAACAGICTAEWPVLVPSAGSQAQGNFKIVTRTDGAMQWSFNGHALYEFSGDSGPDQSNGVYGTWHMARPTTP